MAHRAAEMHPKSMAKIFVFSIVTQQHVFWVYHMNSYANNPLMLRSSKPLLMRDVFLTKCTAPFANPLSTLYVPYAWDMFWNCTYGWLLGMAVTPVVGISNMLCCFFLGGFASGMAYLFQGQLNPSRLRTQYDCNASSNGAMCALAALGTMVKPGTHPHARFPIFLAPLPVAAVSWIYIAQALLQEYFPPLRDWYPKLWVQSYTKTGRDTEERVRSQREQHARLSNWGCIGGVFFGFAYGTLLLRMRANKQTVSTLFESIRKHQQA